MRKIAQNTKAAIDRRMNGIVQAGRPGCCRNSQVPELKSWKRSSLLGVVAPCHIIIGIILVYYFIGLCNVESMSESGWKATGCSWSFWLWEDHTLVLPSRGGEE